MLNLFSAFVDLYVALLASQSLALIEGGILSKSRTDNEDKPK